MAAGLSIDVSGWLEEQLAQASPDLLRAMVTTFAEALMCAEADAVCGAGYGERSDERRNTRNGYRRRDCDTRAGRIDLAIPKLAPGLVLSELAAGAPPPRRGGAGDRGGHLLSARCLHAADGKLVETCLALVTAPFTQILNHSIHGISAKGEEILHFLNIVNLLGVLRRVAKASPEVVEII